MRKLGLVILSGLLAVPLVAAPAAEALFRQLGLFGDWAVDCTRPPSGDNLHVKVALAGSGEIVETHDLGPGTEINRYRILSAARLSETAVAVEVMFQPGTEFEERQKLEWSLRDGTRRTMVNRPERGPPVVKNGVALGFDLETPLLQKCE